MGRKKVDNKKSETVSTKLTIKELTNIRLISKILGINVARFIYMCIQEWLLNHSEHVEIINNS